MDFTELINKITEVGTTEDDVTRRSLLTEIETEVTELHNSNTTLTEQNSTLTDDIQRVREENMKLFLKVSEEREPEENKKEPPKEKRKFEDLFKKEK